MDLNVVRELISMMENSKLSSMELEWKEMRIKLEKNGGSGSSFNTSSAKAKDIKEFEIAASNTLEAVKEEKVEIPVQQSSANDIIIKAPMVGTFYNAPSPDSEPFVQIGKKVNKGEIVCIIEAMKLMNEIESECSGEISEILVKSGDMVEYGQPLFKIKA